MIPIRPLVAAPLIQAGPVISPVVRTAGQGSAAWTAMEIVEAYGLYDFTDRQWAVTLIAGTVAFSWLQNTLERLRGRKLIGEAL